MTTTVLRPNASVSGTPTGAASAHAALSDDSDSSYVTDTPECVVALGTVTLGSGVTKTIGLRARASKPSGSLPLEAAVITPSKSVVGGLISMATTSTIANYDSGPTAVTLTQAEVDALRVLAAWDVNSNGSHSTSLSSNRCYEIFVDLVWVAQPVVAVTAVSPDPYTASNIVPIAWSNTLDSDGGAQTRYHLKVFTAAQYGAGGFDPETSDAFYDSEQVVSSSTTANTAALDTATTYRAYVKVAQTVNGESHWSAWAYDQFQVAVTTSDVDTVAAVASNSTASITVTVERDTGSSAWDYVEVERSVDSGTTWSPVRGATYVDATGDADTFVVVDYETGNGEGALYRARATRIVSDLPITGAWVQSTPARSWTSASAWLKSPGDPTKNSTIDVRTPFESQTYPTRVGVFDVIGSATPVAVTDVIGSVVSTMTVHTDTESDSNDLRDLLRDSLLLYCPTSCEGTTATTYLAVTSLTMTPRPVRGLVRREWQIGYVEVAAPADPDASAP